LELSTIGRNFYLDVHHLMCFISDDNFNENKGLNSRFRLILLQEGTGIVHINDHAYPIVAPAVFCMNEQDSLQFFIGSEQKLKSIYFHPSLINHRFSFNSIY
jgi:hypothetical protein